MWRRTRTCTRLPERTNQSLSEKYLDVWLTEGVKETKEIVTEVARSTTYCTAMQRAMYLTLYFMKQIFDNDSEKSKAQSSV